MKGGKRSILLSVVFFSFALCASAERRPVIGISDTYKDGVTTVPRSYINAVLSNGGIPVVIPLMSDENELIELLNSLDGVIFTGGEDYDPAYYNERPIPQMGTINVPRDKFDIKLLQLAAERGIPVLGICRGVQLINIVFGGSLYQDLPAQYSDNSIRHRQRQSNTEATHAVIVEDHTVFADIVKDRMLMVNSSHHQAIKDVARGFRIAGRSPDKIVEVIEKIDDDNWILGVQFHPEMRVTNDLAMRRIFQRFISEAGAIENQNRTVKPLIASRPQTAHEMSQQSQFINPPPSQIIYRNVVDTQYIYKMVHDTLHISVPPDTVFISVMDTKFVTVPPDTVYISVSDTVYLTHLETPQSEMPQMEAFQSEMPEKEKSGFSNTKVKREKKIKQKNTEKKEQVKIEKAENKAKKIENKQFKQRQKENARIDKKELRANKEKEKQLRKNE